MTINGVIESIVFQNSENGFTVARVSSNREVITIVGTLSKIYTGQEICATGNFVTDSRWGEQFRIDSYSIKEPNSGEGVVKYLSSGLIPGIGPITAQRIVDKFGDETLDIIELNPLKLSEVKGVNLKKAAEIGQTFLNLKRMQNVVMFLQDYNISTNMSVKIFKKYGDDAREIIKTNPYKLVEDMSRVGFKTADKIALNVGIPADSKFRLRAGLVYVLNESSERDGNTYLPLEDIYVNLSRLLNIDITTRLDDLNEIIDQLVLESIVKRCEFNDVPCLMLVKYYNMELKIATKLLMLMEQDNIPLDISGEIEQFELFNKVQFHPDQRNAIETAINNGVCVITGGPGTGKTTIIKCILRILNERFGKIALLAPTGRAAKRMSESCKEEASTIHRALMIDYVGGETKSDTAMFYFNETNKFPYDVVIVDEVSMVDASLMLSLVSALKPNTKLILVGDKNQLPSVGAGNVLADIIASNKIACAQLTHIYRQSESSLIISNAHAINAGDMPVIDNKSQDFFYENKETQEDIAHTILSLASFRIPKFLKIDPMKIQVLAPMRVGVCGIDNLNNILQSKINPADALKPEMRFDYTLFRVGDKVMQTSNNYTQAWKKQRQNGSWELGEAVFNGDIGFVTSVNKEID
ncbi:MAG: AAA family ATPase, partial [Clostridia bacterium]|nr:AAA family ATPase [Clostridia bacterium]